MRTSESHISSKNVASETGSQKPEVSIVVSMYNSRSTTLRLVEELFLPSLLQNVHAKSQVVIIDDGSPLYAETDRLIKSFEGELKSRTGDMMYVRHEQNKGFAGAYNAGIQRADGRIVMIVNDDVYLPKGSVDSLVGVLTLEPKTGVVGPVVDNAWSFQGITLFDRMKDLSPAELQKIEDFSVWLRQVMKGKHYKLDHPRGKLTGASLMFKREVAERAGMFDEGYTYGLFEDFDWLHRVQSVDYDLVVDSATFVEHGGPFGGSNSLKQNQAKHYRAMISNALRYGKKWNSTGALPFIMGKAFLQSTGIFSIQGEIVKTAKKKGLWKDYIQMREQRKNV